MSEALVRLTYRFPKEYKGKFTLEDAMNWIDWINNERKTWISNDNPLLGLKIEDCKREVKFVEDCKNE